ncbi:hypothetical protein DFH27DRAFT_616235 [Peziza echinospora]|nr:hypothetical protein DFH27DRAFT_616235 [Peziza echinospora]
MSLRRLTGRFFHSSYRRGLSLFRPQNPDGEDASAGLGRGGVSQTNAESQGTTCVPATETIEELDSRDRGPSQAPRASDDPDSLLQGQLLDLKGVQNLLSNFLAREDYVNMDLRSLIEALNKSISCLSKNFLLCKIHGMKKEKDLMNRLIRYISFTVSLDENLRSQLESKERRIEELMRDVIRLSDRQPEPHRDDYYFTIEYRRLFDAIDAWAYQYYGDTEVHQELINGMPVHLTQVLNRYVGPEWTEALTIDLLSVIQAVVNRMIVEKVMIFPLLGMDDQQVCLLQPALDDSLLSDEDSETIWRTATISKVTTTPLFWDLFRSRNATALAREIIKCIAPFSPPGLEGVKKIKMAQKLAALIIEAGKIAIESWKEPSRFRYTWYEQGDEYNAETAPNIGNVRQEFHFDDEQELWGRVLFTRSPAVMRVDYKTREEVIVLKAMAMLTSASV